MRTTWSLCGALIVAASSIGIGGCASPVDRSPVLLDLVCNGSSPCTHAVQATTNGFGTSCTVNFRYQTTTVSADLDVSWTLPRKWIGHLEFTDPGVAFKKGPSPADDFTNGRFDGDRGTFLWTSTGVGKRTGKPFAYQFGVVWITPFADRPIPCGSIDPTIVNSL